MSGHNTARFTKIMDIELDTHGGIPLARLSGKLDTSSAPDLKKELGPRIDAGDIRYIVDLSKLGYISSAGLRILLLLGKKAKAAGGGIAFCCVQGMVKEVLAMAYFNTMFPIVDTADQAAKVLRQNNG